MVKSLYPSSKIQNTVDLVEYLNQGLAELGCSVRVTFAEPKTQPADDRTSEIVAMMRPLIRRQEPPEEAAEED